MTSQLVSQIFHTGSWSVSFFALLPVDGQDGRTRLRRLIQIGLQYVVSRIKQNR